MNEAVQTLGDATCIHVKSKTDKSKSRRYDTLQVTPAKCTCRVTFGGDKHQRHQTSARANSYTAATALAFQQLLFFMKAVTNIRKHFESISKYVESLKPLRKMFESLKAL